MEQNVRFQGGICLQEFQLDQIENQWIAAIIDFIMLNIWKTVAYS